MDLEFTSLAKGKIRESRSSSGATFHLYKKVDKGKLLLKCILRLDFLDYRFLKIGSIDTVNISWAINCSKSRIMSQFDICQLKIFLFYFVEYKIEKWVLFTKSSKNDLFNNIISHQMTFLIFYMIYMRY